MPDKNPLKLSPSDLVPTLASLLVICKYNCAEGGEGNDEIAMKSIAIPPLLRKLGTGMHCTVERL
jgi:hypothetical protein